MRCYAEAMERMERSAVDSGRRDMQMRGLRLVLYSDGSGEIEAERRVAEWEEYQCFNSIEELEGILKVRE